MISSQILHRLRVQILQDPDSLEAYSLAECIYRVRPLGIVLPSRRDEVLEVLALAREEGISLTARGAGSAVAGQTLGSGIILDFSRRMNRILEICPEERWVRVEPGVIPADLNRTLEAEGLQFAPDPSSSAFCTVGGMIANNAGGARSVRYGATRDQVLSLIVATADGAVFETGPLPRTEKAAKRGEQAWLTEGLARLVEPRREAIARVSPDVRRIASGYELLRPFEEGRIDLTPLLIGSEGTLALTLEAKLRLIPIPRAIGTALAPFSDLRTLGEAVLIALRHAPSALEALDRSFLDLVRSAGNGSAAGIPANAEAVLIIEMEGESPREAAAGLDRLEKELKAGGACGGIVRALDPESRRRIWEIRKGASPILSARQGGMRNTRFIEDACVPTANLPRFLEETRRLLAEHRLQAAIFGHAGDAILHVNPMIDPTDPGVGDRMERIAREFADMVLSLGGALSGEHGDGRLRTPLLRKAFGGVAEIFREVKRLFDPTGILNPGIKVHDGRSRIVDHMDLGPRPSDHTATVW